VDGAREKVLALGVVVLNGPFSLPSGFEILSGEGREFRQKICPKET
jgi:hypothetical protein